MTQRKKRPILIQSICFFLTIVLLLLTPTVRVNAQEIKKDGEFQAVWISYLEFLDRLKDPQTGTAGFTEERFHQVVDEMFDNVAAMNMNAVVVHVRPFGDAMYPSKYFPWSKYISGTQGKNPGFDPLKYMVSAAHERGLQFHAWINPYRITSDTTDINKLSKDNIARKWLTNSSKKDDRRVLSFGGALYYNPSDNWVQAHIRYGIEEIVENYDVDGIHFDDYFYPTLGSNYKKNFDYKEYEEYSIWCKENGVKTKNIADWRRNNVNRLVKNIYSDIKDIKEEVEFGISPGGFLDYLLLDDRYYTDIKTWLSKPGYIDYICPQLYWSFDSKEFPYAKTLDRWLELRTNKDVKMYVGIAAYRAGSTLEKAWKDPDILKDMIDYGRSTGLVDGYVYFRYDFFYKKVTQQAIAKLLGLLI
jgi:uncharacterized lipoprotein YddW (UPF0748 family)